MIPARREMQTGQPLRLRSKRPPQHCGAIGLEQPGTELLQSRPCTWMQAWNGANPPPTHLLFELHFAMLVGQKNKSVGHEVNTKTTPKHPHGANNSTCQALKQGGAWLLATVSYGQRLRQIRPLQCVELITSCTVVQWIWWSSCACLN